MPEIGDQLREARLRNRIDITEVEAATKIRAKYLRALENEEWDLLPGPTFVKTFLRTYADHLGLDSRVLVEEYRQRYERPAGQELTPFGTNLGGRRARPRRPLIAPWMAVVAGVLLLIGALYLLGRWGDDPPEDEQAAQPVATATPQAKKKKPRARKPAASKPTRVRLQIRATGPVSVCLESAGRHAADQQPDARHGPVEPHVPRPPLQDVLRHGRRRDARRRQAVRGLRRCADRLRTAGGREAATAARVAAPDVQRMSVRAGIVVTGTEVLGGIISDRNGPWLSERLRAAGVELAHIMIVGDRPADVRAALDFLAAEGIDLIITSGGLGPTADDLTADVVGAFTGRAMVLDPDLEQRILAILQRHRATWRLYSDEALRAGNRKQAIIPAGATILEPVGTAPGLVVPPAGDAGPTVVVLPGPPPELQPMWAAARETAAVRSVLARATTLEQRIMRLVGVPESEIALSLRGDGGGRGSRSVSWRSPRACAAGELEVATTFAPGAAPAVRGVRRGRARAPRRRAVLARRLDHGRAGRGAAARPHDRRRRVVHRWPDGGAADRPRRLERVRARRRGRVLQRRQDALADVPAAMIERHGAVSPEVAAALADGAIARFGAELGIGITGIAGPGGGTADKPVGMVCLSVARAGGPRMERNGAAGRRPRDDPGAQHDLGDAPPPPPAGVSLRLFVALDLPDPVRAELASYRDAVAEAEVWRPVDAAAFHITLAFLGHRPDEDAAAVAALLPAGGAAPGLRLAGALLLPPRRARVLTVAVEDVDGALAPLQAAVSDRLAAAGLFVPEKRPFRPHVTLARLRSGARAPRAVAVEPPALAFSGTAVTLYRSHLGRGGATYEPLAVRPLGC